MSGEQALVRAEPDESKEDSSIVLALGDETHTLGNALRDVMWAHPHVQLASYTQEHPSLNEIVVRCQTSGAVTAEQAVAEALHMTQDILHHMADTMDAAVANWQQQHGDVAGGGEAGGQRQQQRRRQPPGSGRDEMEEDE